MKYSTLITIGVVVAVGVGIVASIRTRPPFLSRQEIQKTAVVDLFHPASQNPGQPIAKPAPSTPAPAPKSDGTIWTVHGTVESWEYANNGTMIHMRLDAGHVVDLLVPWTLSAVYKDPDVRLDFHYAKNGKIVQLVQSFERGAQ